MMKICSLLLSIVLVFASYPLFAHEDANGVITGVVRTSEGEPAAYVTIQLKGTKKYTFTGEDGRFVLNKVAAGDYVLEVSLAGYEVVAQQVSVAVDQRVELSLRLELSRKQLDEVIVVGTNGSLIERSSDYVSKMPLGKMENPQVYTTIPRELLREQLVFSVDDAMRNAPGIQKMWEANGRGGDGGAYYNSRGFILQSQLRNGIAGNVTSRIDAANLESIEVIKGPSATLFGNNLTSYGGLINRITKKPYAHFGGEIAFSAGTFGFNRLSADINTPLDKDRNVLFRLNTAYNYEGSFQDNGFSKSLVAAPSLQYRVNDRLSFLVDAELYSGQNTGPQVIFFPYLQNIADYGITSADQLKVDYKRSYSNEDLVQQSRNANFFGQMNYRLSKQWHSQTNITITNSFSDGPSPYYYLLSNASVTGDSTAVGADYISRNDQFTEASKDGVFEFQQNVMGDFRLGRMRNRLVVGLDYFHNNSDQFFGGGTFDTIDIAGGAIPNYRAFNRTNMENLYETKGVAFVYPIISQLSTYSTYASDVLNLTDNLSVLAALRVDHFASKGSYDETTGQYSGGYEQTELSPKFGIVYQPVMNKVSLFGNFQNGFTNQQGVDYRSKAFEPEEANQLEGGVKLNVLGGKLSATISYYDIKVKNIIRPYTGAEETNVPNPQVQDGMQSSKGIEVEAIANLLRGFNLFAGFSYNDSRYERTEEALDGLRPGTASSPYTANLWLSYHLPDGSLKGLGFGFGGNYASENLVINRRGQGSFALPAYTVLNASAFYNNPQLRVSLKVDNLGNQRYWIGYTTINPQKLRQLVGSVAFKF